MVPASSRSKTSFNLRRLPYLPRKRLIAAMSFKQQFLFSLTGEYGKDHVQRMGGRSGFVDVAFELYPTIKLGPLNKPTVVFEFRPVVDEQGEKSVLTIGGVTVDTWWKGNKCDVKCEDTETTARMFATYLPTIFKTATCLVINLEHVKNCDALTEHFPRCASLAVKGPNEEERMRSILQNITFGHFICSTEIPLDIDFQKLSRANIMIVHDGKWITRDLLLNSSWTELHADCHNLTEEDFMALGNNWANGGNSGLKRVSMVLKNDTELSNLEFQPYDPTKHGRWYIKRTTIDHLIDCENCIDFERPDGSIASLLIGKKTNEHNFTEIRVVWFLVWDDKYPERKHIAKLTTAMNYWHHWLHVFTKFDQDHCVPYNGNIEADRLLDNPLMGSEDWLELCSQAYFHNNVNTLPAGIRRRILRNLLIVRLQLYILGA